MTLTVEVAVLIALGSFGAGFAMRWGAAQTTLKDYGRRLYKLEGDIGIVVTDVSTLKTHMAVTLDRMSRDIKTEIKRGRVVLVDDLEGK
ncbi:MAG: hypothetical protein E6R03_16085 [Hyphomicrobiaceae bacterium]|nr:MAG: hypothetical protein E6R03_16085 [Hyphomicrobiaceae bacterium]